MNRGASAVQEAPLRLLAGNPITGTAFFSGTAGALAPRRPDAVQRAPG